MTGNPKLSIIIPCYNEGENVTLILQAFAEAVNRADVEVVIVNNGSTDGTAERLASLLPAHPFIRAVTVPVNQGYGYGILSGLRAARGEYLGWMHGDLQTPPADALRALEIIESRGNPKDIYVKGRRRGRPLFDRFFTVGMGIFETLYLGKALFDVNAQPNVFHRSFFERWQDPPHDFALDLYAFYQAKRERIPVVRFPVRFPKRIHGSSHWDTSVANKWKFIKRTLLFSRELKRRLARRAP